MYLIAARGIIFAVVSIFFMCLTYGHLLSQEVGDFDHVIVFKGENQWASCHPTLAHKHKVTSNS